MQGSIRTARTTGLMYLGLAVTGVLGFLLIRPRLFTDGDPAATMAALVEHATLARAAVVLELLMVLTQALTAAWFYRLFRAAAPGPAAGIAAFGLVNAVVILSSAALLATAAEVAEAPFGDAAATVQTMYLVSGHLWTAGALFFGLWLVPMGLGVLRTGWMPRPLGWILIGGGAGYVLSALVAYLAPDAGAVADVITIPATVGEFWMIGYLLVRGVRRDAPAPAEPVAEAGLVAR
jgi:hypothetical protein